MPVCGRKVASRLHASDTCRRDVGLYGSEVGNNPGIRDTACCEVLLLLFSIRLHSCLRSCWSQVRSGSVGDPPWFEKFVLECAASEKRSCEGLSLSICGVAMVETAQIWRRSGWEFTRKLLTFYFAYVSLQGCGQLSAVTVKTFAAFEMNRLACRGSEGKSISV